MMHHDPKRVFVADRPENAEIVAAWLREEGIPCETRSLNTPGGFDGLVMMSSADSSVEGIEVWVNDVADAPRALELLARHEQEHTAQTAPPSDMSPVKVTCEECGKTSVFPPEQRGSVQNCPHCGGFLDVVSEDAFSEPAEWGTAESEEDAPAADS